ncbi:sugar lactone lactonase YvrE [Bradyrhizobium ottawaense]
MKNRLACAAVVAALFATTSVSAETWEVTKLVQGSAFHGVHGLGIDKAGHLFAGSVAGAALYEVDVSGGTAKVAIPSPIGMADDIAFAPDGTMAWTGFLTGDLYARKGDDPIKKLASGLPGINSLAFRKDGRLYATTVFLGDTLYEIDVEGVKPPRQIMEKMGGLNGFEFGPDDKLYGPLWFKGQVAKVDVDKAELTVVADGFKVPAAVNFDSKGNLFVVDTALGQLVRVDPKSGARTLVAQLKPSLDNLAIDDKDRIYVSNMADNGIQEVDPATGQAKQIIIGKLALPGGIGVTSENGKDTIHLADVFAYRTVDGATGEVTEKARMHAAGTTLEYPMSATAKGNDVVLSSWFTGTVQVIDAKTGATRDLLHGFKGAARCDHARRRQHFGSRARHQVAGQGERRARQGSHHADRRPRGPGRARPRQIRRGLRHRSLCRHRVPDRQQRRKDRGRQGAENARRHRARERRPTDRGGSRRQAADRDRTGKRQDHRDRRQSPDRPRGRSRRIADEYSDGRGDRCDGGDLFHLGRRERDLQGGEEIASDPHRVS